jgi:hypothetical protein
MSLVQRLLIVITLLCASQIARSDVSPAQTFQANLAPAAKISGWAVSADVDTAVIGAPNAIGIGAGTAAGSVRIYQRAAGNWNLLQTLQAPTPVAGDSFGYSVFVKGNFLVAPGSTVSGVVRRGAAYVYSKVTGQFVLVNVLNPGTSVVTDGWFGTSVSVDAGWIAVGAPEGSLQTGNVQMFYYDGNAELYIYRTTLTNSVLTSRFGIRVLTRGDRLFVSATEEDNGSGNRGYVYEFARTNNGATATFAQVQRFRSPTNTSPQIFGSSMALSDDNSTLMVGAPYENNPAGTNTDGAAFCFKRNTAGSWVQTARIDTPNPSGALRFGTALSLNASGSVAVISDAQENNTFGTSTGGAYTFSQRSNGTWEYVEQLVRSAPTSGDLFGAAVEVLGDSVIVGNPGFDNTGAPDQGQALFYVRTGALLVSGFE